MSQITVHNISYNAGTQAFEARVDVRKGQSTFRYPCQVAADMMTPLRDVQSQLRQQALRMSDSNPDLMSSLG